MVSKSQATKFGILTQEEINMHRFHANRNFITKQKVFQGEDETVYLSLGEELLIVRHYEFVLRDFFKNFMPKNEPLPNIVKGTALHFYKRCFLVTSVMDFHPKEMMFTCVFLSCKICEYVVPIDTFVRHVNGDSVLLKYILIDQETELLSRLNFRLNIYTPHPAIEHFMDVVKADSGLQNPDRLNKHIVQFMSCMWNTDICLTYSPPLIALAALMHSVSQCNENIDDFVMQTILKNPPQNIANGIISIVRKIRLVVKRVAAPPSNEEISLVEKKLSKCRNPNNDPTSNQFKQKMGMCNDLALSKPSSSRDKNK